MPVETVDRRPLELDAESSRVGSEIDDLFARLLVSRDDGRDRLFEAMRHARSAAASGFGRLLTVAAARLFGIARDGRFASARRSRRSTSIR